MIHRKTFCALPALVLTIALSASALAQDSGWISAQERARSYIVILPGNPVVTYDGRIPGLAATKPRGKNKVDAQSADVRKYRDFLKSRHDKSLEAAGASPRAKVNGYTFALNGYSAILTERQVEAIRAQTDVLVLEDRMRYAHTDSSPTFLGLTAKGGAYESGYTGEGVVVGIIDTGIWPEHPSFADDGSYAPLPAAPPPCQFGNTAHNPSDATFTCNNKLLGARQMLATYRAVIGADPDEFDSARDDDGHGTHTASTAAGNAGVWASIFGLPRGTVSGIAPRARVIAYKGLGNLGGFGSDLAAAIDQAVADGVDVINYSIGGGASLAGPDDIAFLFAADAGVFVAASAGNDGPGAATVGGPGTVPWLTTVGASTQTRFFEGTVKLGAGNKYSGASITPGAGTAPLVDAANHGNEPCLSTVPFVPDVSGKIVLCKRGVNARVDKSHAVFLAGGAGMILYNASDVDNLLTDSHWLPSVHIDNTPGLAIKQYIATDPAPTAQLATGDNSKWKKAPGMTIFSSRGPNSVAPDIIKPDVTAPGLQILAGNSPFPDPNSTPPGELFQAIGGTSMSSPHIAGVFALLKQAHPEWSPAAAKSALMTTAYQDVVDNDRKSDANPFGMGAGHVDPGGKWKDKGSINQPGLVYDAGLFEYAAFTCGVGAGIFTPGSCDFLAFIGVPLEPYNLNYPSIGVAAVPGSQTVIRTVRSVADKKVDFAAKVNAPKGFEVTVKPTKLKLEPGESATFELTIANKNAPPGEWRFGSLIWKGGGYEVYSPIAVRGAP